MKNYFMDFVRFDPVNHLLVFNKEELEQLKNNISKAEILKIEDELASIWAEPIYSVVQKDATLFPEFSIHDYVSLASYFHPNPNTIDGLPYISKDGVLNYENDRLDKDKLRNTGFILYHHLLLYYLTNDLKYYDNVKKRMYEFFINPETKMNPNMNHAQVIRGVNLGRGIGIIDYASTHPYVLSLFKLLYDMDLIEEDFYLDMKIWLKDFLHWLRFSDIALEERDANNNHGLMYDFLLLVIYDFLGMEDEIKSLTYAFINLRLLVQFDKDGSMPLELERTKSISYALMAFKAVNDFIHLTFKYDMPITDLESWYYRSINSPLEQGFNYLIEHLITKDKIWPGKQIEIFDSATLLPLVFFAKAHLHESRNLFCQIDEKKLDNNVLHIIVDNLLK